MTGCAEHKHPLQHGGTSQAQRLLPGLTPEHVRIDERGEADWIVFAAAFARYLKHYDSATGKEAGDWQAFFANDISAVLGSLAVQDIEVYRFEVKKRLDILRDDAYAATVPATDAAKEATKERILKETLGELFGGLLTLAKALDRVYLRLGADAPFKPVLRRFIQAKLGPALRRILAYHKAAVGQLLYLPAAGAGWKILGRDAASVETVLAEPGGLSADWWDAVTTGPATVDPDEDVYGPDPGVFFRISHAANHFLFTSVLDQLTESYTRLVAGAEAALGATLEDWDGHQPHYALFLSFLKLFRVSQARLNGVKERHLDYYYEDVLKLKPRGAKPNHSHLVAELAKMAPTASLPAGTLFKAGRDSRGKEVFYSLDRETTFNHAEAVAFKAVYKADHSEGWEIPAPYAIPAITGRHFAAPAIDSADGKGAELKTDLKEWHPFVNRRIDAEGKPYVDMPPVEIGFAVASHYFLLAEGIRRIRIRFGGSQLGKVDTDLRLCCRVTTEKGWLEPLPYSVVDGIFPEPVSESYKEIEILLAGSDPAVTAFNPKVHGEGFETGLPVVQCLLINQPGFDYGFEALKGISVSRMQVEVQAGGFSGNHDDGLKNLLLANANGDLDPSKPFLPWGVAPEKDAPFIVGSKEAFTKKNATLNLHGVWSNYPTGYSAGPGAVPQILKGGSWEGLDPAYTVAKVAEAAAMTFFHSAVPVPDEALVDYREPYTGYRAASRAGFLRMVLNGNFGHATYATDYTDYLIGKARGRPPAVPTKPYQPVLSSLYLSYVASSDMIMMGHEDPDEFNARPARFYHIGPFGISERHGALNGPVSLLPRLGSDGKDHVGEWFLGMRDLAPGQAVSLLVQLLEGSTDPLLGKPEKHVTWSYLARDGWMPFLDSDVSDGTRQLLESGIISFAIPRDAVTNNPVMPRGLLWLRASVTEAAAAVCKILSVKAQAMRVTLEMEGIAPDFPDHALPAGAIAKPKSPDARFKKFSQPYPALGGRRDESREMFRLRASARLRHRGRASTLWDYENLVLEAFPQLYRVKCLNHTRVKEVAETGEDNYNEQQPGYVTIVTLPALGNRNDMNPLKPYTPQGLLSEIRDFLKELVTGQLVPDQVNVNVCNPQFEEVSLDFKLKLKPGHTDFNYFRGRLQEEIARYLSPWAYDGIADIRFGGKIPKSALIDFIEDRPYVDFITDVVLKLGAKADAEPQEVEEVAIATTARSILVSAPPKHHGINEYIPTHE